MNALLLCAGLGTRFRPITERVAKPAIPFLNVPLLGYSLFYLEKMGLKNLVLNTHHLPESVKSTAASLTQKRPYKVQYSFEPKILGSGGGIKFAEKLIIDRNSDDFIVANGDEVILFNHFSGLAPLIEFHKKNNALVTMLTTNHPDAGKTLGGVWTDSSGLITRLGEKTGDAKTSSASGAKHFTGVYVFSPRIFELMLDGEFHIFTQCLHQAMASGEKVMAFHDPDLLWLDMTSEQDYISSTSRALKELKASSSSCAQTLTEILSRYQQNFERVGESQWLGPGAKFSGELAGGASLFMGSGSEISRGVKVKGFAVIGAKSKFSSGILESSVIAPGLQIDATTSIKNQLIF